MHSGEEKGGRVAGWISVETSRKRPAHRVDEPIDVLVARARVHEDGLLAGNRAAAAARVVVGVRDEFDPVGVKADLAVPQENLAMVAAVAVEARVILIALLDAALVFELRVRIAYLFGIIH